MYIASYFANHSYIYVCALGAIYNNYTNASSVFNFNLNGIYMSHFAHHLYTIVS